MGRKRSKISNVTHGWRCDFSLFAILALFIRVLLQSKANFEAYIRCGLGCVCAKMSQTLGEVHGFRNLAQRGSSSFFERVTKKRVAISCVTHIEICLPLIWPTVHPIRLCCGDTWEHIDQNHFCR